MTDPARAVPPEHQVEEPTTTGPDRSPWIVLATSSIAVLIVLLDTTALFVAFPDLTASFPDVGRAELSWVLNAYTIAFAALLVPAGKVADRLGHKRAFLTGLTAFTVGSLLSGLAPDPTTLILTRVLQAVGAATLLPSSLALVLRSFPRERIPEAVAIWGATGAVAAALGPTMGAAVVQWAGWQWVFFLNVPIGVAAIAVGLRTLTESRNAATSLPAPAGVFLFAASATLVSLGFVQIDSWGWNDPRTVVALAGGASFMIWFIANQRRSSAPVLDLDLFGHPNFAWGNAASLVFFIAFTAMFFGSILYLTDVWNWSVLAAGFGIAPGPLLVAVLAPSMGRAASRFGQRPLLIGGGVLFAAGGLWRLLLLGTDPDYVVDYLPSVAFTGLGVAMCLPQLSSVVAQALPPDKLGVGGATNQAIRQVGGTLGVALSVALIGNQADGGQAVVHYRYVWLVLVVGGVVTSMLAAPLRTDAAPYFHDSTDRWTEPYFVEGSPRSAERRLFGGGP